MENPVIKSPVVGLGWHKPAPTIVPVLRNGQEVILELDPDNKHSKTGNAIKVRFDMNQLTDLQWQLLSKLVATTFGGKPALVKEPLWLGFIAERSWLHTQKNIADILRKAPDTKGIVCLDDESGEFWVQVESPHNPV